MSHLIQINTVCPLVFELSICLDLIFFEKLQTKILSSALLVVKIDIVFPPTDSVAEKDLFHTVF